MDGYESDRQETTARLTLLSLAAGAACLVAAAFASSPITLGMLLFSGCVGILSPAIVHLAGECEGRAAPSDSCPPFGEDKAKPSQPPACDQSPELLPERSWADWVCLTAPEERRLR